MVGVIGYLVICVSFNAWLTDGSVLPNILVFMTDDLDLTMNGMHPLPKTRKLIGERGVVFNNAFSTTPACCPSRTSFLTGCYPHNHKVRGNSIKHGCYDKRWQDELEGKTFATALKKQNYHTFYAGKYLNHYNENKDIPKCSVPEGWDHWNGLEGNAGYLKYKLCLNNTLRSFGKTYRTDYITTNIGNMAEEFLRSRRPSDNPVLMVLSFTAPHGPRTAEPKYSDKFSHARVPRSPNFNYDSKDTKHWLTRQAPQKLHENHIEMLDTILIRRWRTLLSVDDQVERMFNVLRSENLLDNTYTIFTSDHGYHLGQFGMQPDKRQPYESDIRVPLLVCGPGIEAGKEEDRIVLNIDLAPTILDMAEIPAPSWMDGRSFLPLIKPNILEEHVLSWRRRFLVEYEGMGSEKRPKECSHLGPNVHSCHEAFCCKCTDAKNNTYECIRSITDEQNDLYCRFRDDQNFIEYYDLKTDPYQLVNLAANSDMSVVYAEDRILTGFRDCQGISCQALEDSNFSKRSDPP